MAAHNALIGDNSCDRDSSGSSSGPLIYDSFDIIIALYRICQYYGTILARLGDLGGSAAFACRGARRGYAGFVLQVLLGFVQ